MEARDEERPYDNIPRQGGEHRGEVPEANKESTMNVRAPGPPEPDATGDDEDAEETSEDADDETSASS